MRAALVAHAAAAVVLAGCTGSSGKPAPTGVPLPTLPAGALREMVLQPGDVQRNLVPIAAQTGPADIDRIASFSANPTAAVKSLREHGFREAYVVQYGDQESQAVVTNVVVAFANEAGATADLAADLASAGSTGETFAVDGLGDQAGGVRGPLDPKAGTGQLITLRWRVGALTWLLAVGAPSRVDEAGVRGLANLLVTRARAAPPTTTPSA